MKITLEYLKKLIIETISGTSHNEQSDSIDKHLSEEEESEDGDSRRNKKRNKKRIKRKSK